MRSFLQKHRDLIRTYNEMAAAETLSKDLDEEKGDASSMSMGGKDKIAMTEAVDIVRRNLGTDWEDFLTHLQTSTYLLEKELTMDDLQRHLITKEARKKAETELSSKKGEEKALYTNGKDRGGQQGGGRNPTRRIKGECWNCGKVGHRSTDCRSSKKDKKEANPEEPKGSTLGLLAQSSAPEAEYALEEEPNRISQMR